MLYATDGTPAGTVSAGITGADNPTSLFRVGTGDVMLMAANHPTASRELFVTDGTAAGTTMFDLSRQLSSSPSEFCRAGSTIFFAAASFFVTGRELWSVRLPDLCGSLVESFGRGCAGTNGVPVLDAVGRPILGNASFALTLDGAAPSSVAALNVGLTRGALAVGPCTLLVTDFAASLGFPTDANGHVTVALPVASNSALKGLDLFFQFAIADPNGAFQSFANVSNGLHVLIGR